MVIAKNIKDFSYPCDQHWQKLSHFNFIYYGINFVAVKNKNERVGTLTTRGEKSRFNSSAIYVFVEFRLNFDYN